MKLGENGIAFFVEPNQTGEQLPRHLVTSPLPDNHLSNALAATDSGAPPNGSDVHSVSYGKYFDSSGKGRLIWFIKSLFRVRCYQ